MEKYKVIKSAKQYELYCQKIYELMQAPDRSKGETEDLELLTLLIKDYDNRQGGTADLDPIELLKGMMEVNKMDHHAIAEILSISAKDAKMILDRLQALSKSQAQLLAKRFKMRREAFDRPYRLNYELSPKITPSHVVSGD